MGRAGWLRRNQREGARRIPALSPTSTENAVSLRDINLSRSGQRLLDDVSLDVSFGHALVVRGPNGAGKTTMLKVAAGLMAADSGEARIGGVDPATSRRMGTAIGVAVDEPAFWPWMPATRTLNVICDLAGRPRPDVTSLLEEVGLQDVGGTRRRGKRVGKYSQGMRKRLQVAAALALSDELLLIDEPTSNLDEEGAELVWAALRKRVDGGACLIVCSHDEDAPGRLGAASIGMSRGSIVDRDHAPSRAEAV